MTVAGYEHPTAAAALVDRLIARADYDGVLALGGPMGVYDRETAPYLADSMRLIEDALRRDVPLLGLCLGAQLLAEVLGSPVYPGSKESLPVEVGFFPLRLTEAGLEDPVATLFEPPAPVMLWHQDTHTLPEGAVLLASTATYHIQAFRVSQWVYGLQFHPEAPAETIAHWVDADRSELESWGVDPARVVADARRWRDVSVGRAAGLAEILVKWARSFRAQRQRGSSHNVSR